MSDKAWEELAELWIATFGEAPSIHCENGLLLEILIRNLAAPLPYQPGLKQGSMEIARSGQDAHVPGVPLPLDG